MRFDSVLLAGLGFWAQLASAAFQHRSNNSTLPTRFGVLLFPAFQLLDIAGPLDTLNLLSWQYPMNLSLIGPTLSPISTSVRSAAMNPFNSTFGESITPTHTFSSPPENLDVLLIPGGVGTRAPDRAPILAYIAATYPNLKYLLTVCTGSQLAAEAGVLDYRTATSNKAGWAQLPSKGPRTNWISHARWVVDGNIWTSSGVSAGMDSSLAWIGHVYGEDVAKGLALAMEYERHENASWDPFATYWNLTDFIAWNSTDVAASAARKRLVPLL